MECADTLFAIIVFVQFMSAGRNRWSACSATVCLQRLLHFIWRNQSKGCLSIAPVVEVPAAASGHLTKMQEQVMLHVNTWPHHVLMCRVLFQRHPEPQRLCSHVLSLLLRVWFQPDDVFSFDQFTAAAQKQTTEMCWRPCSAGEDIRVSTCLKNVFYFSSAPVRHAIWQKHSCDLFLIFTCGSLTELFSSAWGNCIRCVFSPQLFTLFCFKSLSDHFLGYVVHGLCSFPVRPIICHCEVKVEVIGTAQLWSAGALVWERCRRRRQSAGKSFLMKTCQVYRLALVWACSSLSFFNIMIKIFHFGVGNQIKDLFISSAWGQWEMKLQLIRRGCFS